MFSDSGTISIIVRGQTFGLLIPLFQTGRWLS